MRIPLDEVVTFDAVTHNQSTGAVTNADSAPTFEVFEDGTDTDIGVGGSMTQRTAKTGNYRAAFTASAANGFEAGKWYNVIVSAIVATVTYKQNVMRFMAVPVETVAGIPKVEVINDPQNLVGQGAVRYAPRGYNQVTSLAAAANLPNIGSAIPADADAALIVAETQNVRWRDDGTDPTTTVGQLLTAGSQLWYRGAMSKFRAIEVVASAKLNVSYFKAV